MEIYQIPRNAESLFDYEVDKMHRTRLDPSEISAAIGVQELHVSDSFGRTVTKKQRQLAQAIWAEHKKGLTSAMVASNLHLNSFPDKRVFCEPLHREIPVSALQFTESVIYEEVITRLLPPQALQGVVSDTERAVLNEYYLRSFIGRPNRFHDIAPVIGLTPDGAKNAFLSAHLKIEEFEAQQAGKNQKSEPTRNGIFGELLAGQSPASILKEGLIVTGLANLDDIGIFNKRVMDDFSDNQTWKVLPQKNRGKFDISSAQQIPKAIEEFFRKNHFNGSVASTSVTILQTNLDAEFEPDGDPVTLLNYILDLGLHSTAGKRRYLGQVTIELINSGVNMQQKVKHITREKELKVLVDTSIARSEAQEREALMRPFQGGLPGLGRRNRR